MADGRVVDPTKNVLDLVDATIKRLDDIQRLEIKRLEDIIAAHAVYIDKLSIAEKGRIDAIRAMDSQAVLTASEQAQSQATIIAKQLTATADGLRKFIESVQDNARIQLEHQAAQISVRVTELERNQYKNLGREQVSKTVIGVVSAIIGALITFLVQRLLV